MKKTIRIIILSVSIFILVVFILFVINQTVQVVTLAQNVHPQLGQFALYGLLFVYAFLVIFPLYLYLRLPRALQPPDSEESQAFKRYMDRLSRRLRKNRHLKGNPVSNRVEIEYALQILNKEADQIIKRNATMVFITTAISQSGRLDTFTVLITQFRLVWQIAHLYYQRPSLRDMIHLYANVAATAFIAGELNDLDISEQVEPIITSVLGATLTGAIPGVHTVAGIITNSLLSGSANAYLTLRIGAIAKQYSGSLIKKERKIIRRSASYEAARMLSVIVMSSAGNISKAMVNAAMKSPGKFSRNLLRSTWGRFSGKSTPDTGMRGEI